MISINLFISEFLSLEVPHSLALLEHRDLLCIADRENMRVACVGAKLHDTRPGRTPVFTIQQPDMGRVYGIASHGQYLIVRIIPYSNLTYYYYLLYSR